MRPFHREQVRFLRTAGAERVRYVHPGGRHPRLVFELAGVEHRIVAPGTPGRGRALWNSLAQLRRVVERGR